tara:strand:- start:175 stop:471 length:297 start_codon:yes stop_codon:yes gene_type:complete
MVFLQQKVHENKKGRVKRQYESNFGQVCAHSHKKIKFSFYILIWQLENHSYQQRLLKKLKTKFTTQNNYQKQPKLFLFIIDFGNKRIYITKISPPTSS